ncbi:MAG: anthranilate phosphoribosyltransferase [Actinomycetaceae bacterium]|nr:anthranilate phosphoribosyltransferase [Actinomycetaceae bacterium]
MSDLEWTTVIARLCSGKDLTVDQAYAMMDSVMSGELGETKLSSFLTALRVKGESIDEVRGLADAMQDHARRIDVPTDVLDIVGTGGDGAHTVNISTMAAIVIASTGIPVVKHGNRAATSACGSADVLERLGINLELEPDHLARLLEEVGITFLFANRFHPSMKYAASVRRDLGFPTVFNILGPLTNPAKPQACAIGVSRPEAAEIMAGVFASRGTRALVFNGARRGLDELSTTEPAHLWVAEYDKVQHMIIDPVEHLGLEPATVDDLRGGDAQVNARVVKDLCEGATGAIRDAVALNAAAGIVAYRILGSAQRPHDQDSIIAALRSGYAQACEAIDTGATTRTLSRWVEASSDK